MMQPNTEVNWRRPTKEFAHPYTIGAAEAYVPKDRALPRLLQGRCSPDAHQL
jgi:hypothetical protein